MDATASSPSDLGSRAAPPRLVGRMIILSKLGEGGMGVVFAAYDPELDRKVAVKMLRPELGASERARERLLREAQALARLTHPNIVAVHDVGVEADRVWLAMEFVHGKTVKAWCAERRRSWREVVEVFVQAVRGIQAAHASGLLHRDLKPANIMIGDDGRVRVMDFGLVCSDERQTVDDTTGADQAVPPSDALTLPGAIMGTPAYMSPEQFLGLRIDGRSDQYSLCVALWEALYGERPYEDASLATHAADVMAGRHIARAKSGVAPTWLRRVAERGLAPRREHRFTDMTALHAALTADPTTRHWALGLGLAVVLGTGGFIGFRTVQHQHAVAGCVALGDTIDEIWNDSSRSRLREGLRSTGLSMAETTANNVVPWLDGFAEHWRVVRSDVCRREVVDGTWDPGLGAEARACLDGDRGYFENVISVLSSPGEGDDARGILLSAVDVVTQLPVLTDCEDVRRLRKRPSLPDDVSGRGTVQRLNKGLAMASALDAAGRYQAALTQLEGLQPDIETLGWTQMRAIAAFRRGQLLDSLSRFKDAEAALEHAFFTAGSAGDYDTAADAAEALASTVAQIGGRTAESERWLKMATMILEQAGIAEDDIRWSQHLNHLGLQHKARGEVDQAIAQYERSLEIKRAVVGPRHLQVANTLINLGAAYREARQYEKAVECYAQAREIVETTLGREHPRLAILLGNLGNLLEDQGEYERAINVEEQAVAILERSLGAEDLGLAVPLNGLGIAYRRVGDLDRAIKSHKRCLTIRERTLGPEHVDVAISHGNLAIVYAQQGFYDQAIMHQEHALAIKLKIDGPNHPRTAITLLNLGLIYNDKEEFSKGAEYHKQAIEILTKAKGPDYPTLAYPLAGLGVALIAEGKHGEARVHLERALALQEKHPEEPADLGEIRFALARALISEPERARALAEEARDELRRGGRGAEKVLARVEAWLSEGAE